jgi:hypothetical protein
MIGRLARAAYILTLAAMIAVYALSVANSSAEPQTDEPVIVWYV